FIPVHIAHPAQLSRTNKLPYLSIPAIKKFVKTKQVYSFLIRFIKYHSLRNKILFVFGKRYTQFPSVFFQTINSSVDDRSPEMPFRIGPDDGNLFVQTGHSRMQGFLIVVHTVQ